MTPRQAEIARKRLAWIEDARKGICSACDDVVNPNFTARPTVDPLKWILKITLNRPLAKATRAPLRQYLRTWAKESGCELPVIRITNHRIQAEILTESRQWFRDAKGKFTKTRPRFERGPGRSG